MDKVSKSLTPVTKSPSSTSIISAISSAVPSILSTILTINLLEWEKYFKDKPKWLVTSL